MGGVSGVQNGFLSPLRNARWRESSIINKPGRAEGVLHPIRDTNARVRAGGGAEAGEYALYDDAGGGIVCQLTKRTCKSSLVPCSMFVVFYLENACTSSTGLGHVGRAVQHSSNRPTRCALCNQGAELDEAAVEGLVREFAASWKSGIEAINQDVLSFFSNFRNGMEILKQVGCFSTVPLFLAEMNMGST